MPDRLMITKRNGHMQWSVTINVDSIWKCARFEQRLHMPLVIHLAGAMERCVPRAIPQARLQNLQRRHHNGQYLCLLCFFLSYQIHVTLHIDFGDTHVSQLALLAVQLLVETDSFGLVAVGQCVDGLAQVAECGFALVNAQSDSGDDVCLALDLCLILALLRFQCRQVLPFGSSFFEFSRCEKNGASVDQAIEEWLAGTCGGCEQRRVFGVCIISSVDLLCERLALGVCSSVTSVFNTTTPHLLLHPTLTNRRQLIKSRHVELLLLLHYLSTRMRIRFDLWRARGGFAQLRA
mmetsp:Transcript_7289/g.11614  ORF Transcript_7289/g.11614 Transcript_7289/m.11614 type:complete len:292 (+) Transcript_7289:540-1415(+)